MIDAEVMRLRRLRNTALRVRALARVLESDAARRNSLLSRSARSCWRVARVSTGTLRGHPYPSFQRGPSALRSSYYHVRAALLGGIARHKDRRLQTFYLEMLRLAREVDDIRALTLSAELSDTLGRSQIEIRGLLKDLHAGARTGATRPGPVRAGALPQDVMRAAPRPIAAADDAGMIEGDWPYIAL